jgi:hypothetical protein
LLFYVGWGFLIFMVIMIVLLFFAWMSPLVLAPIEAFIEMCKKNHAAKQKKGHVIK